jgi:hypothetical protein
MRDSMADYSQVAQEIAQGIRAEQDAWSYATQAAQHVKNRVANEQQPLRVFFEGVETALEEEVNKANPELSKQGLLTGEAIQGIVFHGQIRDDVFNRTYLLLTFGNSRRCEVTLDPSWPRIKAVLSGDIHSAANGTVHLLTLPLEKGGEYVTARTANQPEETPEIIGAQEVAEIVVMGVIRGHFE